MKSHLEYLLSRAIEKTAKGEELETTDLPPLFLEPPKQKEFGDLASNVALVWAKKLRRPPRAVAEAIAKNIEDPQGMLARVEIAGPGFLNFTFSPKFFYARLEEFDAERELVPRFGGGEKVQVEIASANPTGPLHVGHGRVAVIGDVLARLLDAAGFSVEREYYVNDAGNQMEKLGQSIYARYRELFGEKVDFPEDGYPGEYVKDVAAEAKQRWGDKYLAAPKDEAVAFFRQYGGERLLQIIRDDLSAFGISLDSFVSEKELRARGAVEQALAQLAGRGMLYEQDGARWFRSTAFGDDKDRPLVKSDGELTYFASDIAYHRDKLERGFAQLINVWGADHHGYVPRLKAGLAALGYDPERLRVVLVQLVQLTRGGEPVRMGKRSGEFVSLAEVVEEVGADAARFFFLMRKSDSHLDFDLDLAKKESSENPVFYVQYAHARIASIFEQARDKGAAALDRGVKLEHLAEAEELGLIKRMLQFAETVRDSVTELEPHRVAFYLLELAGEFHRYYNRLRVITDDPELTAARLFLLRNVQKVVARGLNLLGVSAPLKMAARTDN
ncbi:MAG TPA: arginine--tRNA ligase [Candidatus Binatia bacterium]|jgi:arginyl-tRNA synthetase